MIALTHRARQRRVDRVDQVAHVGAEVARVGGGAQVVEHRRVLEQLQRLERAAEAGRARFAGDQPRDRPGRRSVQRALGHAGEAGDGVDQRGLAGAVRARSGRRSCPGLTVSETSSTAVVPPKRTVRSRDLERHRSATRSDAALGRRQLALRARSAPGTGSRLASFERSQRDLGDLLLDDAVLVEQDQQDQRDAADQRRCTCRCPSSVASKMRSRPRSRPGASVRADHGPDQVADAADHRVGPRR